jgi:hypothetical protein
MQVLTFHAAFSSALQEHFFLCLLLYRGFHLEHRFVWLTVMEEEKHESANPSGDLDCPLLKACNFPCAYIGFNVLSSYSIQLAVVDDCSVGFCEGDSGLEFLRSSGFSFPAVCKRDQAGNISQPSSR